MNPDVIALQPGDTVDDAIRHLRSVAEATPIVVVYVVDEERRLLGFVRMRRMVTARPSALLGDIMSTDVIVVQVDAIGADFAEKINQFGGGLMLANDRSKGVRTAIANGP